MKTLNRWTVALCLLLASGSVAAQDVAVTIDDLPFVGNTKTDPDKIRRENMRFNKILEILRTNQVPATGFVITSAIGPGQWELLQAFRAAGNIIGNHTDTHISLARHSSESYIENIRLADTRLQPLLSSPKYFRYPFLAEGAGTAKYATVRDFLKSLNYQVAPVTIDSKDFKFNYTFVTMPWRDRKKYVEQYRKRYLTYIWAQTVKAEQNAEKTMHRPIKQILLIHMNTLNFYFLQDIIDLYRSHGYRFISLPEALQDPYYEKLR